MSQDEPRIGAATMMKEVLKENMAKRVENVRKDPTYIRSLLRITAYKDHNKLIKDEFKQRIQILDEKYGSYTMWMDIVQVSIIVLAATSSFLQAGDDIIGLNKTVIGFITLIISSYTGLVLALAKYKKIDEKKENINNLRHQCADFLTQIQTRTDKLNTWCYDRMWAGGDIPKMAEAWRAEDETLYNELKPLIEKKQALTCEFERILDSLTVKKTSKLVRARNLKYKKISIDMTEAEDDLDEKENKLEADRKHKLQTAFYNKNNYDSNSKNDSNNDSNIEEIKKEKDKDKEEIKKLYERIKTLYDQFSYASQLHTEKEAELVHHKSELEALKRQYKDLAEHELKNRPESPDIDRKKSRPLEVNDRVKARYKNSYNYHWGTIDKCDEDGTFCVRFDESLFFDQLGYDIVSGVPRDQIKLMTRGEIGSLIDCQSKPHPIVNFKEKYNKDVIERKIKNVTYKVGEKVKIKDMGAYGRGFYLGKIEQINDDGTYSIKYNDIFHDDQPDIVEKEWIRKLNENYDNVTDPTIPRKDLKLEQEKTKELTNKTKYKCGDRVSAKIRSGTRYYKGEIWRINRDGTYRIRFDDGDWDSVKESEIKIDDISDSSSSDSNFIVNERVECRYPGRRRYYKAKIKNVNDDGTYDVLYDDGDRERRKASNLIRKLKDNIIHESSSDIKFIVNERVECIYKEGTYRYYKAKIKNVNDDGTYDVLYDDGDKQRRKAGNLIRKLKDETKIEIKKVGFDPTIPDRPFFRGEESQENIAIVVNDISGNLIDISGNDIVYDSSGNDIAYDSSGNKIIGDNNV